MMKSIVGLFDDPSEAQNAVHDLLAAGVSNKAISVITTSGGEHFERQEVKDDGSFTAEAAATGMTAGAVVGGALGLLAGAGLVVLPIGLAVVGPLAGFLAGTAAGAAGGGLMGGLIGLGMPDEHAHAYAESVRQGGAMVTVEVDESNSSRVEEILDRDGAVNIESRSRALQQKGWSAYESDQAALTPEEWSEVREHRESHESLVEHEQNVMQRERTRIASYVRQQPSQGQSTVPDGRREVDAGDDRAVYEDLFASSSPNAAFDFGYESARTPDFSGHDWGTAAPLLRTRWEADHGGMWDENASQVQEGWNKGHADESQSA